MGRTGAVVTGLVAVALGIGVVLAVGNDDKKPSTNTNGNTSATPAEGNSGVSETEVVNPAAATISYKGSVFSPSQVTVKAGDTVAINNESSEEIDLKSDPHPIHTSNPELSVGLVVPGEIKIFKVEKKGTWGYHNHLDPAQTGTIVVK